MSKKELCIIPSTVISFNENNIYVFCSNKRTPEYCHRHEIFFGINRQNSIKYGLVTFLNPEHHNMSDYGVHFNKEFDNKLKKYAQKTAMKYYNWDTNDFIQIFGKNYL